MLCELFLLLSSVCVDLVFELCFRVFDLTGSVEMSIDGWAPGTDSIGADTVAAVARVADPASRGLFESLLAENQKMHNALDASIAASNAATSGLSAVTVRLDRTNEQLATVLSRLSHVQTGGVLYPMVINASSPIGTASSTTAESGSSVGSGSAKEVHNPDGPLPCPFCSHRHDSEKVHHQHMLRLIDRFVMFTSSTFFDSCYC